MGSGRRIIAAVLVAAQCVWGACEAPAPEVAFCEGTTHLVHAPETGRLTTFPDDFFTVEDPGTVTGLRVAMRPGVEVDLQMTGSGALESHALLLEQLSTLDGFGVNADLVLVFSGPLDEATLPPGGDGSGRADGSVLLVDLEASPPAFLDFEWEQVDEGDSSDRHTLVITPVRPLRPGRRHGLAVTTGVTDEAGGCVAPSEAMRQLLGGTASDPRLARLEEPTAALVETLREAGTIEGPGELTAAVVFTTQSTWQTSAAVAERIRQQSYAYQPTGDGTCLDHGDFRECAGSFEADDYRTGAGYVDDDAALSPSTYTIPVVTYLPPVSAGPGPFPTLLYAHSLTQDRFQAALVAAFACPLGMAVVAIDAVRHGEHPDQPADQSELGRIMAFLGIQSNPEGPWDGLRLRGNMRQSAYDKLQLLELLRGGVDVDGDGTADLGVDPVAYAGASLGGIMGPELLSFAPQMRFALLIVPGARLSWIIQHAPSFEIFRVILQDGEPNGEMARIFPLFQTIIDRGDAGSYTRHVLMERLAGFDDDAPEVLMQIAVGDEVVPNRMSQAYAAGLGLPLVGDPLLPMAGVETGPALPASGNLDLTLGGGPTSITAGLYQYDVVWVDGGPDLAPAGHRSVADNPITVYQSTHFLSSFLDTGDCEILDPYYELGVK